MKKLQSHTNDEIYNRSQDMTCEQFLQPGVNQSDCHIMWKTDQRKAINSLVEKYNDQEKMWTCNSIQNQRQFAVVTPLHDPPKILTEVEYQGGALH